MWEFLSQNLRNKISVTDFFSRLWGMRETNTNSKLEYTKTLVSGQEQSRVNLHSSRARPILHNRILSPRLRTLTIGPVRDELPTAKRRALAEDGLLLTPESLNSKFPARQSRWNKGEDFRS